MEIHLVGQKNKEEDEKFIEECHRHQSSINLLSSKLNNRQKIPIEYDKVIIAFSPGRLLLSYPPKIEVHYYHPRSYEPHYISYLTHDQLYQILQKSGYETDDLVLLEQSFGKLTNIAQNHEIREKYLYMN